jgi:hypothetical protein
VCRVKLGKKIESGLWGVGNLRLAEVGRGGMRSVAAGAAAQHSAVMGAVWVQCCARISIAEKEKHGPKTTGCNHQNSIIIYRPREEEKNTD